MFVRPSGIVTLTTDFGRDDPYVGIVEGALLTVSDKPRVVHLSHAVPPQDVAAGAFVLWSAVGRFPAGTVHVGVVDPGVGTDRQLLAVAAGGQYWLVPDNGLIGAVLAQYELAPNELVPTGEWEARTLDLEHLRIRRESATFDGRDVLGPVAAMLASGRYGFRALGPRVANPDRRDLVFGGGDRVVHVDRFGNLISNVRGVRLEGVRAARVGEREAIVRRTYGAVAAGELLAYVGAFGLLEFAVRDGSARQLLELEVGAPVALSLA